MFDCGTVHMHISFLTMIEIRTLVYFDLEATGLKSSGRPRVSEISLVAVNSKEVLDLHFKIMDHFNSKNKDRIQVEGLLPRVMNKLTLCVYPMATIVPLVSSITGLDNYNLTGQSRFDKNTGDLLNSFLSRLPGPVCLVAHNGNMYDFPLLKAELEKAGTKLSCQLFCVDSYVGIKEIFKKKDYVVEAKVAREKEAETEMEIEAVMELINAGEFDTEMNEAKLQSQERTKSYQAFKISQVPKQENEFTPDRTTTLPLNYTPRKKNELTDTPKIKFRKKLNFSCQSTPSSFSLINLHTHFLGCPPSQSHGAEADCLALLRTTSVLGKEWLVWADDNCSLFEDCKKMWGIVKIC